MKSEGRSSEPKLAKFRYRMRNPDKELSSSQFEQLAITAEDLRYLETLVDEEEPSSPPAIRAVSTIMRRLFCSSGDFSKAVRLFEWQSGFRLKARMLDCPNPQKLSIVSAGNYVWGNDVLPGISMQFGGPEMPPEQRSWDLLDDVETDLWGYLRSLAFSIFGTRVRREQIILYVANKKAAHVSESRKNPAHQRLDDVWQSLYITRSIDAHDERLNAVYLELATILHTISTSEDIRRFTASLLAWLSSAEVSTDPPDARQTFGHFEMKPVGQLRR